MDRSADAQGRLDNLKELVRSMEQFENLMASLSNISLVMDVEGAAGGDAVNIMTLHSAWGWNSIRCCSRWEEGVFPNQRALVEQGRAGLEEERRLAYVGLTRARRRAKVVFAPTDAFTACGSRRCRAASSTNCRRRTWR